MKIVPPRTNIFFISSDLAFNLFFKFCDYLQDEALDLTNLTSEHSDFEKISEFLFQKFTLEDIHDSGSLENAIMEQIEKLKSDNLYLLFNSIRNDLTSLRKEKTMFWETILEKYRLSKDKLDKNVFARLGKFDSELESLSKKLPDNLKKFNSYKE